MNTGNRAFRFLSALCWSAAVVALFALAYARVGDGIETALPGIMLVYLIAAGVWLPVLFPVDDARALYEEMNPKLDAVNSEFLALIDGLDETKKNELIRVRDQLRASFMNEHERYMGKSVPASDYDDYSIFTEEMRYGNPCYLGPSVFRGDDYMLNPDDVRSPLYDDWDIKDSWNK